MKLSIHSPNFDIKNSNFTCINIYEFVTSLSKFVAIVFKTSDTCVVQVSRKNYYHSVGN